ncbi:MAG: nucleotidyltransferase domain-containing protein [Eubacterium sp.]|nr:nucleotidyltransferase domain-containing protein [Eubacterium sp.]
MDEFVLTNEIIKKVKKEAFASAYRLMGGDLTEMILYGSCARGDFTNDSDVDIALLTKCSRVEAKKYDDGLDLIAANLAMKYFAVVNFVCLPYNEFQEKKTWYAYFRNIEGEGEVIYG